MQYFVNRVKDFILQEDGNESVELAVLFPIILLIVGFIIDRFIQYEGVTAVSSAANEAIRYAVVAETREEANNIIKETLSDRMDSSKLGWCRLGYLGDNAPCMQWDFAGISTTNDRDEFESNINRKLLITDSKGWCNGSYLTLGVRAHKASVFPSYESFRKLLTNGGPIYHKHTYIVTARVESNKKCGE